MPSNGIDTRNREAYDRTERESLDAVANDTRGGYELRDRMSNAYGRSMGDNPFAPRSSGFQGMRSFGGNQPSYRDRARGGGGGYRDRMGYSNQRDFNERVGGGPQPNRFIRSGSRPNSDGPRYDGSGVGWNLPNQGRSSESMGGGGGYNTGINGGMPPSYQGGDNYDGRDMEKEAGRLRANPESARQNAFTSQGGSGRGWSATGDQGAGYMPQDIRDRINGTGRMINDHVQTSLGNMRLSDRNGVATYNDGYGPDRGQGFGEQDYGDDPYGQGVDAPEDMESTQYSDINRSIQDQAMSGLDDTPDFESFRKGLIENSLEDIGSHYGARGFANSGMQDRDRLKAVSGINMDMLRARDEHRNAGLRGAMDASNMAYGQDSSRYNTNADMFFRNLDASERLRSRNRSEAADPYDRAMAMYGRAPYDVNQIAGRLGQGKEPSKWEKLGGGIAKLGVGAASKYMSGGVA